MPRLPALRAAPAFLAPLALPALLAACITKANVGSDGTVRGTVQVCSSCHGPQGRNGNPTFPVLAGQQHDYLVNQLKAFRDHTRADPHAHTYMWGMAAKLTDPTIDGVAAYYASQAIQPPTAQDPALAGAGRTLFAAGLPSSQVPACANCHGENGEGNGEIPRLASQHRQYLQRQLAAFQVNSRANEMMHENARHLTPQQIAEVSAYLASIR